MNITLRQINYFLAVAEAKSVSKAAASLGIAQSAVTESIRALEVDAGAQLFDRHSKGVSLTYKGHQFLRRARLVVSAVDDAKRALSSQAGKVTGVLNLGVTSLVTGYYLADLLARFRRVFPEVRIKVVEEERSYVEHLLINGELHLALMLTSNIEDSFALHHITLERSRVRVWIAPSHPFGDRHKLSLGEVAEHSLIELASDEMTTSMGGWWQARRLRPTNVLKTSSVEAVRSLVATGAGTAVMPDLMFRPWSLEGDRLEARQLQDDLPTVDVGLAWRSGSTIGETARMFVQLAEERHWHR
jgi:DNA-binding transcriptional LysR family regulator